MSESVELLSQIDPQTKTPANERQNKRLHGFATMTTTKPAVTPTLVVVFAIPECEIEVSTNNGSPTS